MSTLDESHSRNNESSIPQKVDYGAAFRLIYENGNLIGYYSKADDMNLHNRILHLIMCQVLNLRKGSYARATKEDIVWMARIIVDNPLDLREMVVKKMIEAVRYCQKDTNHHGLPYVKHVMKICLMNVSIFKDEQVNEKCTMARFDGLSLSFSYALHIEKEY